MKHFILEIIQKKVDNFLINKNDEIMKKLISSNKKQNMPTFIDFFE